MGGRLCVTDAVPYVIWACDTCNEIARFWRSVLMLPGQFQQNSVSDCQSVWSRAASLRATATLARFGPSVSASF